MKICVLSDSHGAAFRMIEAVRQEVPDFVFFLGDGEGDLNLLRKEFPTLPAELVCRVGSCLFFLTHGHRFGVKYERNFRSLTAEARKNGAQAALFGHTHEAYLERLEDEVLLMNPGSLRGYGASYGILEIREGKIIPRIVRL